MVSPQTENTDGGKLLASLRQKAGLTQIELAKQAEVSRSMIAQLESGERRPSQKLVHALCQAMNTSREEERQLLLAYNITPSGHTPDQIAAFLRADKNLTNKQAEHIANMVREAYKKALSDSK
jgi:transcriptional regulator with XRE-family HTH domain